MLLFFIHCCLVLPFLCGSFVLGPCFVCVLLCVLSSLVIERATVLSPKSDSDVMFYLLSYQGLIVDRLLVC